MPTLLEETCFRNSFVRGSQVLRKGRQSIENQVYFITFKTKDRQPIFDDFENAKICCRCINDSKAWPSATLLCWVLMPDHFHGLVQLNSHEPLEMVIQRFKAHLTRSFNLNFQTGQTLWQSGFHDYALRTESDLLGVARYIVMNPISEIRPLSGDALLRFSCPTHRAGWRHPTWSGQFR